MTLREHLEAIRDRHTDVTVKCHPGWPSTAAVCEWCGEASPCPDYLASLASLNLIERAHATGVGPGMPEHFCLGDTCIICGAQHGTLLVDPS